MHKSALIVPDYILGRQIGSESSSRAVLFDQLLLHICLMLHKTPVLTHQVIKHLSIYRIGLIPTTNYV